MVETVKLSTIRMVAIAIILLLTSTFFGARWAGEKWAFFPYRYQYTAIMNAPGPGEQLFVRITVDRSAVCPNEFHREIFDGQGRRVEQFYWRRGGKPLGFETYVISLKVPETAKPGPDGKYCISQSPKCNMLQSALDYWTPQMCVPFTVAEPVKGDKE